MGWAIVVACCLIGVREQWFLKETTKGQRLVRRFGPDRARWVMRGILALLITLGMLLANGVIRPIRWQ